MVLNYYSASYIGWPLSRFIITLQRYEKFLNYASIYVNIFSEILLINPMFFTRPSITFSMAFRQVSGGLVARNFSLPICRHADKPTSVYE